MELTIWLLSGAVVFLLLFLITLILVFRMIVKHLSGIIDRERQRNQKTLENLNLHQERILENQKPTELVNLLSKTVSLLSTKDPISYQQVQLMDSASTAEKPTVVDNSDHGELQQWIEDNDELTPQEKELYRELDSSII